MGVLINRSKSYANTVLQLEQMMQLNGLPDALFWDVAEREGSKLTALQLAAYCPKYQPTSTMGAVALRMLVRQWYEPEHLNAQVAAGESEGRTVLHIAALTANVAAVRYLLDEEAESLDLTLLDTNGYSVVDTAAWGLVSQEGRIRLWDLPAEARRAADPGHWERVNVMLARLLPAGAKPRKIGVAVTRTEKDRVEVFNLQRVQTFKIPFSTSCHRLLSTHRI